MKYKEKSFKMYITIPKGMKKDEIFKTKKAMATMYASSPFILPSTKRKLIKELFRK